MRYAPQSDLLAPGPCKCPKQRPRSAVEVDKSVPRTCIVLSEGQDGTGYEIGTREDPRLHLPGSGVVT